MTGSVTDDDTVGYRMTLRMRRAVTPDDRMTGSVPEVDTVGYRMTFSEDDTVGYRMTGSASE